MQNQTTFWNRNRLLALIVLCCVVIILAFAFINRNNERIICEVGGEETPVYQLHLPGGWSCEADSLQTARLTKQDQADIYVSIGIEAHTCPVAGSCQIETLRTESDVIIQKLTMPETDIYSIVAVKSFSNKITGSTLINLGFTANLPNSTDVGQVDMVIRNLLDLANSSTMKVN
jgi:hypothetical protein